MLSGLSGISLRDLATDTQNIYKGAVIENYVVQEFASHEAGLYYYKPSESMEIDLIYDDGRNIIPIEIKSGRHKRSTSLKNYMEKYQPDHAIRISGLNFGASDQIWSVPLYAIFGLFLI